jgi:hypothetical protein
VIKHSPTPLLPWFIRPLDDNVCRGAQHVVFCSHALLLSFLPCFVRNAFLPLRVCSVAAAVAAATPVIQESFFTFLRLSHAYLCCSIRSSSLHLLSHSKTCCLSVCLFFSVCHILGFSLGMSDSSCSLQFSLDQLGSRTRSCCLAGSICLMN